MTEILIAILAGAYLVGPIIMLEQARRWKREARALLREARDVAEAGDALLKQSLPVIDDALQRAAHVVLSRGNPEMKLDDVTTLCALDAGRAAVHALKRE